MKLSSAFLVALTAFAFGGSIVAQDSKPVDKPAKKPVYDEKADAKADIDAALARAAADNKRVLVVFGANWCGWCTLLSDLFKSDKGIAKTLLYEYEVVKVDIGKWNKHTDISTRYEADLKGKGVPYLTVLDAAGKVLTNQDTGSLEDGKKHDPAKVQAFLDKWKATPIDAEEVMKKAFEAAAKDGKTVMMHTSAPWCGWCRTMDKFFHRDEVAAIMSGDYVMVKIDNERMTHGADVEKRFRKNAAGGIPWTAMISANGEVLAVSEDEKGENIGHPWEPAEIGVFMHMVKKTAKKMTAEQMTTLESMLTAQKSEKAAK